MLNLTPCRTPGCPDFGTSRGYCTSCKSTTDHARQQRRGPRVYDRKRWRLTRRRVLFLNPLCQCDDPDCTEIATDVHHIEAPEDRPDLAYALSNLRALSHACHSKITKAEQNKVEGEAAKRGENALSDRRVALLPRLSGSFSAPPVASIESPPAPDAR